MVLNSDMPKPGCFGSPLCHHPMQTPCSRCPFKSTCGPISERVAVGLRRKYGIEPLLRTRTHREARNEIKTDKPKTVATGSIKVQELMQRLQHRGIDLRRAVSMRANPFSTSAPAYMRVTLDHLFSGGFTRPELKSSLIASQGWTEGTANAHVSIAVGVLLASGAAWELDGRIVPIDKE